MPILSSFDDLAQGLSNFGGPVLPWLLGLGLPVILLGLFAFWQVRRARRAATAEAETRYAQALKRKTLEPGQVALVEKLAAHVPDPLRRHELLTNARVFQVAAERALRAGGVSEEGLAALRVTLAFKTQDAERTVFSTAQLAVELPLIVEQEKVRRFRARIENVEPGHIAILTEDGEIPPAVGSHLQVYFKKEAGVFTFPSRVISLEGSRARITHSEKIGRYQKRAYYRRKLNMPVMVRVAGSEEKKTAYRFLDLGGGGASIVNPDLRFRPGDDIEITFSPGTEEPIELIGEVVRLSDAGKTMHVSFGPMREAMRDRIIGFILNVGKKD